MKANLMFPERDFDGSEPLPAHAETLIQDLELNPLFDAMAAGDDYLRQTAVRGICGSVDDISTIRYRQQTLADCLAHPDTIRRAYAIAVEALEEEHNIWGWRSLRRSPDQTLHRALQVMRVFVPHLRELRELAGGAAAGFRSKGFTRLWQMLEAELSEEFLHAVEDQLQRLALPSGVIFSCALGADSRGTAYVLHEPPAAAGWWARVQHWPEHLLEKRPQTCTYEVAERDEVGYQALADLQGHGIARAAAALGQSAGHVLHFFSMLRVELAFYIGCLNLHAKLAAVPLATSFPDPFDAAQGAFCADGLYDVALALKVGAGVVPNDIHADGKSLVLITGANRGGKSTLLRAVGQAQLMMQSGLFVPAATMHASVCRDIFTHFKREEDATMRSGKLDEELQRMSAIVERIRRQALLLCNESFGSTNEREGSEIARQILHAMLENGIRVVYVTHLFDLADGFRKEALPGTLFLRAERLAGGGRSFHIEAGDPLPTSHGGDLYRKIFAGDAQAC